jgi:hypothetical protein
VEGWREKECGMDDHDPTPDRTGTVCLLSLQYLFCFQEAQMHTARYQVLFLAWLSLQMNFNWDSGLSGRFNVLCQSNIICDCLVGHHGISDLEPKRKMR